MTTIQFPEFEKIKMLEEMTETKKAPTVIKADPGDPRPPWDYEINTNYKPHVSQKLIDLANKVHLEGNDNRARQLIKLVARNYENNPIMLKEFYNHEEGSISGLAEAAKNYLVKQSMPKQETSSTYITENIAKDDALGKQTNAYFQKGFLDIDTKPNELTKIIEQYTEKKQEITPKLMTRTQDALYAHLEPKDISYNVPQKIDSMKKQKQQTAEYKLNFDSKRIDAHAYFTKIGTTL